jgi:hypothetical protein
MTPDREPNDEGTGLPGFRTWRSVYVFVLALFAVYLALLIVLTRTFP